MRIQNRVRTALVLVCLLVCVAAAQVKRPLAHRDYDSWRSVQAPKLSDDGRFAAYGVFPQEGDGEVVVRNLATGKEFHEPAGSRPQAPPPNPLAELTGGEPIAPPTIRMTFSADSTRLIFATWPTKAERDSARKAKKRPDDPDAPKNGLAIMDLSTGTVVRLDRVKSFQLPEAGGWIVYLKEAEKSGRPGDDKAAKAPNGEQKAASSPEVQQGPPSPLAAAIDPQSPGENRKKKEYGSELVLRNLASGAERRFADVSEYAITKDAAVLVYAVNSRSEETNGVYAVDVKSEAPARVLLSGKGRYTRLAWDERQNQLAFLSDRDDQAAKTPKLTLFKWDRNAAAASALVSVETPGFHKEFVISEKGEVAFSRDGQRIFFGAGLPPTEKEKEADDSKNSIPDDEKVSADLWHWKDDYIQPMQKVRAELERTRSFRAVYHIPEKRFVQLADRTMSELTPSDDGLWALGGDDREYRSMIEYDERFVDSYLVNTLTGERKLLVKKHLGRPQWSPNGKYVAYFNGKDWVSISVPTGTTYNLTEKLNVKFYNEQHDSPGSPSAASQPEWTREGRYLLISDYYDVWQIAPDGSSSKNLTQSYGRKQNVQFRIVRFPRDRDREERFEDRFVDASKPILVHAERLDTRDSGFYSIRVDGNEEPKKLIFGPRDYATPIRARNADVLAFTASRFDEYPELQVTDSLFREPKKITNVGSQMANFTWGSAELIRFRNADGVPLSGTLYKPANFDPQKKYPMLVYIYERLSQNLHQFVEPRPAQNINPSYYTSNGYLVLMPDIVYTVGQPGQSAMKCVLPAIDAVVARGIVNENAIGIQGHSWGGYQIAYMITQTNRFRAVAAGAPVSNMTSAYDGVRWGSGLPRQFQYERTQSRIGGTLWQYPMRFIENSPVFMADRVRTPIMILHNDADDAVPWYQGIEYFLALRRLGKEVYMFTYNGEPHGIRRRANQKDYTVRLQQYFDHFLQGAPAPDWMEHGVPYLERDREKDAIRAVYKSEEPKATAVGK